ncbi:MAG: hypothetical protein KDA36_13505 [Planctomycetaceae bacterium]|nr:hypothetical protein [Planctomycetaceae bacterium]
MANSTEKPLRRKPDGETKDFRFQEFSILPFDAKKVDSMQEFEWGCLRIRLDG